MDDGWLHRSVVIVSFLLPGQAAPVGTDGMGTHPPHRGGMKIGLRGRWGRQEGYVRLGE